MYEINDPKETSNHSDKDEINDLRCLYEELKKEVIKLKEHKCPTNPIGEKNIKHIQKNTTPEEQNQSSQNNKEEILRISRNNGFKRAGPQSQPECQVQEPSYKCNKCNKTLESKGLLEGHVKEKHERFYECDSWSSDQN